MTIPVPLLNIWSGYSVLRSTWRFEPGLDALSSLGYSNVGLADWDTLAGAEIFDRAARSRGMTPWIGVSLMVDVGSALHMMRLYAVDEMGWRHLCLLMQGPRPLTLDEIQSPHVLAIWAHDKPGEPPMPDEMRDRDFFRIAEEYWPPNSLDNADAPLSGWWVPAWPIRWHDARDGDAYRALGKIGGIETLDGLRALPPVSELVALYPPNWWARCLVDYSPERVLPPPVLKLPKSQDSPKEEFAVLQGLVDDGLPARYPAITAEVLERRNQELKIIHDLGFAGYFLIVADLVQFARKSRIRVGPGRGSAAGSLVAYCLGITDIDPLKYQLIFERFLNPSRKSMPDIDLDFDYERRYELIEYLRTRWGADRVAQIGTFGTLGARAVVRDVGRVLGISAQAIDQVASRIGIGQGVSSVSTLLEQADPTGRWSDWTQKLEGLPRHVSTHAAGVVIAPGPLSDWVPCSREETHLITQMEMSSLERLGMLKLDLLGLRTLTVIEQVETAAGLGDVRMDCINPRDPKTLKLLGRGDTEAVFQLDGGGVVELLRALRPQSMEDIMTVVALYRPGPMDNIGPYLERRRKLKPIPTDPVARLVPETYGILVYQEQLMMVIRQLAGYTWAEADLFRRAISKKDHELLSHEKVRLLEALTKRGMPLARAEELWRQITAFADYGFNKSHAAAYGTLSYYVAYLKAHYLVEFWAAELSTLTDSTRLQKTLDLVVASGIVLLPPDVNASGARYAKEDSGIRVGLSAIRGISRELAEGIVQERRDHGPYLSVTEFMSRIGRQLGDRAVDVLDAAGAFAGMPGRRANTTQMSLFDEGLEAADDAAPVIDAESSLGWRWPVAGGPIYVRMRDKGNGQRMAGELNRVALDWPGPIPVVLAGTSGRGRQMESLAISPSWQALEAIRQIDGVLAAGRQIERLKEVQFEKFGSHIQGNYTTSHASTGD